MFGMEQDFKAKGSEGAGCTVLLAARRKWVGSVCDEHPDFEAFARAAYVREARLSGGDLFSLAKERVISEQEAMQEDLYSLTVQYEEGEYSKQWVEPKTVSLISEYQQKHYLKMKAWRQANCIPIEGDELRYRDAKACRSCGSNVRLISTGTCCECDRRRSAKWERKA